MRIAVSYPAISLTKAIAGRHRRPPKRLQTAANPPSTRIRARTIAFVISSHPLPVFSRPQSVSIGGFGLSGIYLEAGDLSGVDFSYSELVRADFENTKLWGAQLRLVQLRESNLRGTDLSHATTSSADLADVDLNNARLNRTSIFGSNLDGATFYEATLPGTVFSNTPITQTQLDQSRVDPHNPPKFLDHPVDHSTGKPLHWHGEPLG